MSPCSRPGSSHNEMYPKPCSLFKYLTFPVYLKAFITIISHTAQRKTEQMSFGLFALNSLCILWIGITTLYYCITVYLRGIIRSSQIIQN